VLRTRECECDEEIKGEMAEKSQSFVARSRDYVTEVQGEFNKITWPPQPEWVNGTISVVVVVALIATFLGVVDFGLSRVMQMVLG
jgi:preprotein translocase subunit SecE